MLPFLTRGTIPVVLLSDSHAVSNGRVVSIDRNERDGGDGAAAPASASDFFLVLFSALLSPAPLPPPKLLTAQCTEKL